MTTPLEFRGFARTRNLSGQLGANPLDGDLGGLFELVDLEVQRREELRRPGGQELARQLSGPLHGRLGAEAPAEGDASRRAREQESLHVHPLRVCRRGVRQRGQRLRRQAVGLALEANKAPARDRGERDRRDHALTVQHARIFGGHQASLTNVAGPPAGQAHPSCQARIGV
eukprot:CAMPEP_0168378304 /NCGR_PEP_ID=MMETSP0228-20121227/11270_1 /TAXON_ID=133427 /ORGANISM="Protoceratium reticulatum, Strain CCCM 535 (=CCMP 1889)" /LENGTH=170 /DNA_ID=CAMNT_0008391323 /DNA_START=331 /DNA_END=844 /DNA_ORIENTATION=+